jgi:hypothetical protein
LLPESQTANARDDRQRINRARQNAEDLFRPRQQTIRAEGPTSAPDAASSAEPQPRRQPRIFTIQPQMPTNAAMAPPTEPKPIRRRAVVRRETREIPASQPGRVRALMNYGMTREQVAELYGVAVDEVERIIGREGRSLRRLSPEASR